jgi:hypothetical protein
MWDTVKIACDSVAIGTTVATVLGYAPPIAAVLSIIWLTIQIYDRLHRGPK